MKKIIYSILFIFIVFYIVYIKFYLPVSFISYENYHGISYLNELYGSNCNNTCYSVEIFFYNIMNYDVKNNIHGYFPKLFYSFILNFFNLGISFLFTIQSFLSILTYFIISYILFLLSNRNIKITLFYFFLLLTLPHQIKYGYSEDYYILGNFLISSSLLFYTLFLKKINIFYYFISIIFFIFSIYTRNLYLLYLPIFAFLSIYYLNIKNITQIIKNHLYKTFFVILGFVLLAFPVYSRLKTLIFNNNEFSKNSYPSLNMLGKKTESLLGLFPIYYIIIFGLGILFVFFIKGKTRLIYLFSLLYIFLLFYKYLYIGIALERHILLIEPLIFIIIAIGLYLLYILFTYKIKNRILKNSILIFFICLILLVPLSYKDNILKQYSMQEEYNFIYNNISKLKLNKGNLILPDRTHIVAYDFPNFLFITNHFDFYIYSIDGSGMRRLPIFLQNYEDIKTDNNIFYLSSVCYTVSDYKVKKTDDGIREDCQYILDNYKLEKIIEKDIVASTYILPIIRPNFNTLKIGFYKIIGKK